MQKAPREPEVLNEKMERMIANSEAKIHFDQAGAKLLSAHDR